MIAAVREQGKRRLLLKVITYDVIILFVNFKQAYIIHIELNFILSRLPFLNDIFINIFNWEL